MSSLDRRRRLATAVPRLPVLTELVVGQEAARADATRERLVERVVPPLVQSLVLGPHEALAAERADERPVARVRAACVLQQVARLRERRAADVADEGQLAGVQALMHLQRRPTRKRRSALVTGVRPAACVPDTVVSQVPVASKAAAADGADVRTDTGVQEPMILHRRSAGQRLSAVRTRLGVVRRPFPVTPDRTLSEMYYFAVSLQHARLCERLAADRADMRAVSRVSAHMPVEKRRACEREVAECALVTTLTSPFDALFSWATDSGRCRITVLLTGMHVQMLYRTKTHYKPTGRWAGWEINVPFQHKNRL